MTHSLSRKSRPTEADLAFEILQSQGKPMYYHHLIVEVLRRLDLPQDAHRISMVLTQINLDTRFAFVGQGEWGLKVWVPTKGSRRLPTITLMNKALAYDDEDKVDGDDLEDLDTLDDDAQDADDGFDGDADENLEEETWE